MLYQAVTFAILLLSKHPEWQTRLREEVWAVCGRPGVPGAHVAGSHEDLASMPLLQCAFLETLRLYPPAPVILREALEDVEIAVSSEGGSMAGPLAVDGSMKGAATSGSTRLTAAGRSKTPAASEDCSNVSTPVTTAPRTLTIKAGTYVDISIACMHRDERSWDDPDTFNPLRFDHGIPGGARHPMAFLPFSAGQRNCIGAQFALLEAKTILAVLLQSIEWQLGPGYRHHVTPAITLNPSHGVPIKIRTLAATG